tara:strand:- start:68873 stop:70360 length:1488 start_codon:yes stop_codon:yes gene_type:complete
MAEERELNSPPLTQGDESIPRIRLGQISYNGLNVFAGNVYENCNSDLRWPKAIFTYKKMAQDATIAPALSLVEMAIARVPWTVKIPEGYEDELKDKAEFLRQCMNDMDHSWGHFIRQCVTFNRYGFAVHEKVYRKRTKAKGSKYDDGLIGIASLPLITQDSIESWDWDESGRNLIGLYQYKNKPTGKDGTQYLQVNDDQWIRKEKFLHFRNSYLKDDPVGISPLASCYVAWKYKTELEKFEGTGVANDARGLKHLKLNPRYLDPNASEEDKQVLAYYQNMLRNLHMGEQSGVITPSLKDENGKEMIAEFELLGVAGSKAYDVTAIISRYQKEIITSLMASQLILGQEGGGSFSLAESLQGISDMAIEAKLIEIREQLNHDLIPQLFSLNGWDASVTPYFEFGDLKTPDLDVLSKFIQRVGAAGMLSQDAATVNWIAEQANMPTPFDDVTIPLEEVREQLTGFTSNAGEGMEEGMPSGTGDATGGGDQSTGNSENT